MPLPAVPLRKARPIAFTLLLLPTTFGCRAAVLGGGTDLPNARAQLDGVATALESRFTNVSRTPKFANARLRLGRYAFSPSRLVNDSALWTGMQTTARGADRTLELQAQLVAGSYRFDARPGAPLPSQLGEQRHTIRLTQQAEGDWLWHTAVQHHVGTMPPRQLDAIVRGLLASAERPAADLRADYRTTLPRTTAAFGRVVSVDSISTAGQSDGSTLVRLQFRVDADRIRETFPAYARFLRKYVESSKWGFRLTDARGAEWFDVQSANKVVTMRFRTHDGRLQPIAGAARAMPDTLQITANALAKFGLFTVGATDLRGDFVHLDSPTERGWLMRFTREPHWHLPLIGERLMRSPLKHLFAGDGVRFRIGFRATASGVTYSERSLDLPVRESAIMRFLGNLGFTAMSDFAGAVEEEENRFLAENFRALRSDLAALPLVP